GKRVTTFEVAAVNELPPREQDEVQPEAAEFEEPVVDDDIKLGFDEPDAQ
ncbi:MAG TPA: hypothetical protein IAA99_01955, partial [Candidatus Avibacteroides faecavium]|nr:hypothetical protein [Candidatus Avibacteroides faecavium]